MGRLAVMHRQLTAPTSQKEPAWAHPAVFGTATTALTNNFNFAVLITLQQTAVLLLVARGSMALAGMLPAYLVHPS